MRQPHRRSPSLRLVFALALATVLSACAARPPGSVETPVPAAALEAGYLVERREISYEAEQHWREVRIVNRHGDLRIRRGLPGRVGLSVVTQRFAPEWRKPRFDRREESGTLALTVGFDGTAPGAEARFGRIGRVDLVAFVPEDVRLIAETDDGALLIRHRRGPIEARSRAGRLHASSGSALQVENERGSTLARLAGAGPFAASDLRSGTGSIDLLLPRLAAYQLSVEAAGGVLLGPGWYPTDGLEVPPGSTRFRHRSGIGGAPFRVHSAGGPVSIGAVAEIPENAQPVELE